MNTYYELRTDSDNIRPVLLDRDQRNTLNFKLDVSFIRGQAIRGTLPEPLRFSGLLPDDRPPHFLEGDSIPVISKLLLSALKEAGVDNFEVFPAVVYSTKKQKEWDDYFAFNEIGVLDIVNLVQSKYDTIMPGNAVIPPFLGFHNVVFSNEKLKNNPKLFRILQNKTMLFVNSQVIDSLTDSSPPEHWGIDAIEIDLV